MKTRTIVSIFILVLAVLVIIGGCATTPKTQKERESVNQEVFFKSAMRGDYVEVKRLIEEGADVSVQNTGEATALTYASLFGHTEIVKMLIKAGAKKCDALAYHRQ